MVRTTITVEVTSDKAPTAVALGKILATLSEGMDSMPRNGDWVSEGDGCGPYLVNWRMQEYTRETTPDPNSLVGECVYCGHVVTFGEAEDSGSATEHRSCHDRAHNA